MKTGPCDDEQSRTSESDSGPTIDREHGVEHQFADVSEHDGSDSFIPPAVDLVVQENGGMTETVRRNEISATVTAEPVIAASTNEHLVSRDIPADSEAQDHDDQNGNDGIRQSSEDSKFEDILFKSSCLGAETDEAIHR
jgi:hypothetical protein